MVLVVGLLVVTCDLGVFFVCCMVAAVSGEILVLSACAALIACIKVGLFSGIIVLSNSVSLLFNTVAVMLPGIFYQLG